MDLPRPFGPYTLLRRLAVGGMAEVYVARTRGIGGFEKLVALKVIHPRFSEDEHFIQMLVEEAKITVLLNHVNIAQIFDLGCIEDTYFIVMEYIEGADAYRCLKRAADRDKKLPLEVCAFIASEVCNGLDYAHRKRDSDGEPLGIVHRDISPQNVLLSYAGEVKLVDFGIAKAALRTGQTEAGVIKGKYYYMSPEQAWGDPMDHRSDIFSAGVVLYELLTGDMLYQEDNIPQLLDKVRKAEIEPPSSRRSDIPPELDAIVLRAVAKKPEDRYQSAHEMGQDLAQLVYGLSPSFTAARLSDLMAELFEEELRRWGSAAARTSGERRLPSVPPEKKDEPTHSMEVMGVDEFAPDPTKSVIFDLDEEDEDATRNDVLPYRRRLEMQRQREERERAKASAAAAKGRSPRQATAPIEAPGPGGGNTRPLRPVQQADAGEVEGEATLVQDPEAPAWDDETVDRRASEPDWDDESTMVDEREQVLEQFGSPDGAPSPPDRSGPPRPKAMPPPPPARPMPPREPSPGRPSAPSGGPWPAVPAPPQRPRHSHWPEPSVDEFDSEPPTEVWSGSPAGGGGAAPSSAQPQSFAAVGGTPSGGAPGPGADPFVAGPAQADTAGYAPIGKERSYRGLVLFVLAVAALIGLGALGAWLFAPEPPQPVLEVISVPPGGTVALDGRQIGETAPVRITDGLSLDRQHRVEVSMDGYETWTTTFQPTRGLVKQIAVLRPQRATLRVESDPPGAHIWVDDVLYGSAPLDVPGLSIGREVQLRATKAGHREARQTVSINASDLSPTVTLELEDRDD